MLNRRTFLAIAGSMGLNLVLAGSRAPAAVKRRRIIFGRSQIVMPKGATIGTQVDRVLRDIAWTDSRFDERVTLAGPVVKDPDALVPYMEGRLSAELIRYAGVSVMGLTPCDARKSRYDLEYYGSDGKGEYPFKVDPSKVAYKTAAFTADGESATLPDTHGFNMVAGQAARTHKMQPLALVIACMDIPSKAVAARYLAKQGINCYGPCDHNGSDLLGYRADVGDATIIGTAPIRQHPQGAVIGAQTISVDPREPIVVQAEAPDPTRNLYCDTPRLYFQALGPFLRITLNLHPQEAGVGQAGKVVAAARAAGAGVIGVRVFNGEDARPVEDWLAEKGSRRAILFHSAVYDEGYALFFKFPRQTSFGDLQPVIA